MYMSSMRRIRFDETWETHSVTQSGSHLHCRLLRSLRGKAAPAFAHLPGQTKFSGHRAEHHLSTRGSHS